MVALLLLAVILLGLLAGLLTVYQYNLLNFMRDEAGSIAQECVENLRALPYASIPTVNIDCNSTTTVAVNTPCLNTSGANIIERQIRNVDMLYNVGWEVVDRGTVKEVTVNVCWEYRGRDFSYRLRTFIGR